MQYQSDIQINTLLDKHSYNEADLVMVKVPLSLPYMNEQSDFERVNGEITINGKILKYVKRKISAGNLILMCLPDHNKMIIELAKGDFFKGSIDLVQNNPKKQSGNSKAGIFKNLSVEYDSISYQFVNHSNCFLTDNYYIESKPFLLPSAYKNLPEHPPQVI